MISVLIWKWTRPYTLQAIPIREYRGNKERIKQKFLYVSHAEYCKFPEDKKHYILGHMDGVIDCSNSD